MTRLVSVAATGLETAPLALGRPGPFLTSVPASTALARCNLEISVVQVFNDCYGIHESLQYSS
jgi:hypothetical protein